MTKTLVVLCLLLVLAMPALASICDQTVYDGANVLKGQSAQVEESAKNLISQGADVHIITTSLSGAPSLDALVANLGRTCPNWKSANGGVKANMVILALAIPERKLGIFTGPQYTQLLGSNVDRVKRDYMIPSFKGGDYAAGFMAASQQLGLRLKSALDESNKPVMNQTVNQASAPTDFHGLWIFFWILGGLAFIGVLFLIINKVRAARAEESEAQQKAVSSRNAVTELLATVNRELLPYTSDLSKHPGASAANSVIEAVSEQYNNLARTLSGDPSTDGLTTSQYKALEAQFDRMQSRLESARSTMDGSTYFSHLSATERSNMSPSVSYNSASQRKHSHRPSNKPYEETDSARPTGAPEPAPVPAPTQSGSNNDLLTGVLLGEVLSDHHRHEEPSYSAPEPEPEPERHHSSSSSSSSSDSWGGSSSSFDSGSSSSSFDSGSSSFDSGSSFGGGSSDF